MSSIGKKRRKKLVVGSLIGEDVTPKGIWTTTSKSASGGSQNIEQGRSEPTSPGEL